MKNPKPTPETDTATSLKRKKTCKGGREHDWVEVLPWGYEAVDGVYNGIPEPVYEMRRAIQALEREWGDKLLALGIASKSRWQSKFDRVELRHYICSVCYKKDYREKD